MNVMPVGSAYSYNSRNINQKRNSIPFGASKNQLVLPVIEYKDKSLANILQAITERLEFLGLNENEIKSLKLNEVTGGIWQIFKNLNKIKVDIFKDISLKFPGEILKLKYVNGDLKAHTMRSFIDKPQEITIGAAKERFRNLKDPNGKNSFKEEEIKSLFESPETIPSALAKAGYSEIRTETIVKKVVTSLNANNQIDFIYKNGQSVLPIAVRNGIPNFVTPRNGDVFVLREALAPV